MIFFFQNNLLNKQSSLNSLSTVILFFHNPTIKNQNWKPFHFCKPAEHFFYLQQWFWITMQIISTFPARLKVSTARWMVCWLQAKVLKRFFFLWESLSQVSFRFYSTFIRFYFRFSTCELSLSQTNAHIFSIRPLPCTWKLELRSKCLSSFELKKFI